MVKGVCPYCELNQDLFYPEMDEGDAVAFFTKMEEPVITDSFNEMVMNSVCTGCGKKFHFMLMINESKNNNWKK